MAGVNSNPSTDITSAERAVIRAAMGIVNEEGWAFETRGGAYVVNFPGSMRKLENAIAKLKQARKDARRK